MSKHLDWFPESLYPVAIRVARADECAYEMARLAGQWSFDGPLELVQYRREGRFRTVVKAIRPIPPRISLLFSEAVNHLRAALDNVVWHLVDQAHGPVEGWLATQVAMPIHDKAEAFDAWCTKRVAKGLAVFGDGTPFRTRIRSLQPFEDSNSSIPSAEPLFASFTGGTVEYAHPLKLLQSYSNADKHRAIRPTLSRTSGWGQGQSVHGTHRGFAELRVGDTFSEGVWGEPDLAETTTAVMIERPKPYNATVSPANEIGRLCSYVADAAIPMLVAGTALPGSLPLQVDLNDSGCTEFERLAQGGSQTAAERMRGWMTEKLAEADQRPVQFPEIIDDPDQSAGA